MLSLIVGAALAGCGLAFVLLPLLVRPSLAPSSQTGNGGEPAGMQGWVEDGGVATGITAVEVLREIEFDRATGKLSEADYGTLKSTYTARALDELRSSTLRGTDHQGAAGTDARAPRGVCVMCAATFPPGALYCARCAHYLAGECPTCHGPVRLPAARYCSWCGGPLWARASRLAESRR